MNPLFDEGEEDESEKLLRKQEAILAAKRQKLRNIESIAKELKESSLMAESIVASMKPVEIEPPKEIYRPIEKTVYQVEIPKNAALKKSIDRLAGRVIRHGEDWAGLTKVDGFEFLERGMEDAAFRYFRWRALVGIEEDFQWWDQQQVSVDSFTFLVPPPLPPFNETIETIEFEDDFIDNDDDDEFEVSIKPAKTESKDFAFQKWLTKEWERKLRRPFENSLRQLTLERDSIALAMKFCIEHFRFSEPIADSLLRSIESIDASFEAKVARLYLVSDIIFNTTARVPEALQLCTSIERRLSSMLQVFGALYQQIEGRLKAEMVRRVVVQLVDLWEKWAAFSRLLCQNYRDIFVLAKTENSSEIEEQEEEIDFGIDGTLLNVNALYPQDLVNPLIDGEPINNPEVK